MEKYLKNGQDIFDLYCSATENTPIMLPRAPEQTYIDLYSNDDQTGGSFKNDIQRQLNYEAEVKVYRALEKLEENIIVLHNFEYTHHQYRLCDTGHVRKGCSKCKGKNAANKEGECDFLIMGSNYFVIIEVKDMEPLGLEATGAQLVTEHANDSQTIKEQQLRALNGTFHKSLEQRKRIEELIHCIDENMSVFHFTAYPNFSRGCQNEFHLTDAEMSSIIFREDLVELAEGKSGNPVADILEFEADHQYYQPKSRYKSQRKWYTIDQAHSSEATSDEQERESEKDKDKGTNEELTEEELTEKGCGEETREVAEDEDQEEEEEEYEEEDEEEEENEEEDEEEDDEDSEEEYDAEEEEESSIEETAENFFLTNEQVKKFSVWWKNNVRSLDFDEGEQQNEYLNRQNKVRNMLLAIWCTDKDKFIKEKCSLAHCVITIDEKLRSGKFTFRSKNPSVIQAPAAIKNFIGVSNLTLQQYTLFNSCENLLWINGPAGTGKTVILCSKIIQIVKANEGDVVVLIRFCGEGNIRTSQYQDAFKKADIRYLEILAVSESTHTPSNMNVQISNAKSTFQVIIVEVAGYVSLTWLSQTLNLLQYYHVFVDDIQVVMVYDKSLDQYKELCEIIQQIAKSNTVYIACDIAQYCFANEDGDIFDIAISLMKYLLPSQLKTLSKNLRNTCDLSNISTVLRNQFIEYYSEGKVFPETLEALRFLLPEQLPGHFIHGPKTVLHILKTADNSLTVSVLSNELYKLYKKDVLNYCDITIVYDNLANDLINLVSKNLEELCDTNETIRLLEGVDCLSAEWPAVIVLHEVREGKITDDLETLYLKVTRARVYCAVLLFAEKGKTFKYKPMLGLLDKLKDYAQVILH